MCVVGVMTVTLMGQAQYNEQDIRDYIEMYSEVAIQKMNEYT